jgi:acyl-CoA synthetase (AMP-forming)/AMP-acid ligase II
VASARSDPTRRYDEPVLDDVLRRRAREQPDAQVYLWREDDDIPPRACTYAELDHRARRIAAWLQASFRPGDRALLMCEPGLDYIAAFMGSLYARVIPVPAYPPSPWMLERAVRRLQTIVADAEPVVALTTSTALELLEAAAISFTVMGRPLSWHAFDTLAEGLETEYRPEATASADVALLQYTSGSTGDPKGVVVTHGNLIAQLSMIADGYRDGGDLRGVSWLPPYHDMGLVGGVLSPIWLDQPGLLMSPAAFLRKPIRWLRAISEHRANWSAAPDFAYELAVRRTTDEERAGLDLSSWRIAINGAEPVRAKTIARFIEAFAPYGFQPHYLRPSYGLAETTLLAATAPFGRGASVLDADATTLADGRLQPGTADGAACRRLVSVGHPPAGGTVIVVQPEAHRVLGPGQIGEIWVSGAHVAAGYWRRPTETAAVFDAWTDDGRGPFLRTGDLGGLFEGELFITGRLKDVIIIRGRNLYPHDVEQTAEEADEGVRGGCVAAFSVASGEGLEHLVVAFECADLAQPERVRQAVSDAIVRNHDVRPDGIVALFPKGIPKTSSGKIQRAATRELLLSGRLDIAHEWWSRRWRAKCRAGD